MHIKNKNHDRTIQRENNKFSLGSTKERIIESSVDKTDFG
jgi:hypothetical protein